MDENCIPAASQKSLQYDIELGGKTQLPFAFNVEEYVAGHIEELKALTNAIENPTKTKLAFQRLPKHMRRRVMSHNVKRMPARLREAHAKYLQKQNLKTPHRPSRKFRRRPSNLLAEYNRRARRAAWLETHIWHAKRFAMVEAWGYKLARAANEKSYRASVRALDRHCLLQDISYWVCLELSGPESHLIQGLSAHFDSRACFTPGAQIYRAGCREGHGMFYGRGRYPFEAVGNVKFLWRPTNEPDEDRTLWLWCHPSYYQTVVKQLSSTFSLEEEEQIISSGDLNQTEKETSEPVEMASQSCPLPKRTSKNSKSGGKPNPHPLTSRNKKQPPKVPNSNVELEKLAVRNIPHTKIPAHSNVRSGVRMRVLKDVLNRFEVRGPLSGSVIARALNLFTTRGQGDTPPNLPVSLLDAALRPEEEDRSTEERLKLWRLLRSHSPSQFPPRVVLGATVRDPRFNMPSQRIRNELDTPDSDEDVVHLSSLPSPSLSISPIWDPDLRDWVSTNKPSTHATNCLFAARLVSGVPRPEELSHALPVPLLLIQQEGTRRNTFGANYKKIGFASGWDIVFPAGWSMPLLLGLIFNGARVGGLREASQLSVQMRSEPALGCDTRAWSEEEERRSEEARETYFRKPPKNRANFFRLGNVTPFSFPWTILSRDWQTKQSDDIRVGENRTEQPQAEQQQEKHAGQDHQQPKPYVLRDKTVIQKLNTLLAEINSKPGKTNKAGKGKNSLSYKPRKGGTSRPNLEKDISPPSENFDALEADILNSIECRDDCLVQVNVQIIKRGTVDKYAHICLPSEAELKTSGVRNQHQRSRQGFKEDYRSVETSRKYHSQHLELDETTVDNSNIQEPLHRDGNQLVRKALKEGHKKMLLRLKRRRVRAKKKGSGDFDNPKRVRRKGVHPTKELVEVYQEVMRKLWIPDVEELAEKIIDPEREESGEKGDLGETKRKEGIEGGNVQDSNELVGVKKQAHGAKTLEERLKKTNISVEDQVKNYLDKVSRNIQEENRGSKSRCHDTSGFDGEKKKDSHMSCEVIKERKRCLNDAQMDVDEIENTPKRKKTENLEEFTPSPGAEGKKGKLTESKSTENHISKSKSMVKASKEITKSESTLEVQTKLENYDSDVTDRVLSRLGPIKSLRFVASHELFGFVTSSSFHSTAQYGQGCVMLNGLLECMRRSVNGGGRVRVLVRRSGDVNYHWAEISVV